MKRVTRYLEELDKRTRIQYILLLCVTFLVVISQTYGDFLITMRHSLTFWTALFDGHPLEFYTYCAKGNIGSLWGFEHYAGIATAEYDFPIYLYFAIWNFPVWLYEKVSGLNSQGNLICMIYAKTMIVLTTILTAYYIEKIQEKYSNTNKGKIGIYFLSSCIIVAYTALTGNYDIIGIMFMMIGVYYYLCHEDNKFVLFFAIAISLKYFALLPFLLLVLYRQKNVLKIVRDIIFGCSIVFISKGLFLLTAINKGDLPGVGIQGMSNIFMEQIIPFGMDGRTSIFVMLFFILCIWAYCLREEDSKRYSMCIYFCFASFSLFIMFCSPNPYWAVILIPFLYLEIYLKEENRFINILLSTIFEISLLLFNTVRFNWVMGNQSFCNMFLFKVFKHSIQCRGELFALGNGFSDILLQLQDQFDIMLLLGTFAFTTLLLLLIINFPLVRGIRLDTCFDEKSISKLLITRFILMLIVVLLPMFFYVAGIVTCVLWT